MREIYYNSDVTPSAINEIKLLTLYYDKITVVNDAIYSPRFERSGNNVEFKEVEELQFIPKSFKADYKILIDEKILSVTEIEDKKDDAYAEKFAEKISKLINVNQDVIFPNHPTEKDAKIITEEVYNVMKYMLGYELGNPVERDFMWWYYSYKLKWSIKLLIEGKNCIGSSSNLNTLFAKFISESQKTNEELGIRGYSKSLALDAIKLRLPNPDNLAFEDILELKHQLKNELEWFSQTINSIEIRNKSLFGQNIQDNEYRAIFFDEIQKPLKELETKMKNLRSKTFRGFIEKMQNPLSYAPLMGTVVASAPIEYTIAASVGLTGIQSYTEYKEQKRELNNNGLYFLLKL